MQLRCLCGLVIASLSYPVFAESSEPEVWLNRMQEATIQENYRGTFVFTRGEMASTVQVVHRFKDGLEMERLTQLDGEQGEIIRTGNEVMCVLPDNRVIRLEQDKFSNRLVQALSGFMPEQSAYALSLSAGERLIGRNTMLLEISAVDQDRYSYRVWLDQETALMLKSLVQDQNEQLLERFQYTHIEFPEIISDEELSPISQGEIVAHEMIRSVKKDVRWPGKMDWEATWVPNGYKRLNSKDSITSNVLLYSDGLATFSIFVEQVEMNTMPQGASMVGATVAYFHKVMTGEHHYGVTVMGEIPPMTAMKVAEAVKPAMKDVIE